MNPLVAGAPGTEVAAHAAGRLREEGYCVVRQMVDPAMIHRLSDELDERFERTAFCNGLFFGRRTKRLHGLLKRSSVMQQLVLEPRALSIAETLLLPFCDSIQLNLTQAIEIHPGAPAQIPHRDHDMWRTVAGIEYQVNLMWPLTDFRAENGATRIWPRTHSELSQRRPPLDEAVIAEMAPGDLLLYLGSVVHAGGANRCERPRRGVVVSYSLGWLKSFENMALTYPPVVASTFPRALAELVGYRWQVGSLGHYDGNCPSLLLEGAADEFRGTSEVMSPEHQHVLEHFSNRQCWP